MGRLWSASHWLARLGTTLVLGGLTFARIALAQDKSCREVLIQIPIGQVARTQHGNRLSSDDVERLRLSRIANGGHFLQPIVLNQFEDGSYALRDGQHRFDLLIREGVESLSPEDVRIENYTYAEYNQIHLPSGWTTPFDPRQHLRLAQLRGYRRLLTSLQAKLSLDELEAFIRKHPEAYRIDRSEAIGKVQKVNESFEGSLRDRQAYFLRMDLSMPIKIAQLLPVFPSSGILYEPGTGSGTQAAAYAAYHPSLLVAASDLDLESVRHAQSRYQLPNLVYFLADASERVFPDDFVDAVVDSSLGHHIVTFGPPAFTESNIDQYRREVARILKPGGRYGMRDFVTPRWPKQVIVELPLHPQPGPAPYGDLPLPKLFEDFATRFRSHDYPQPFAWKIVSQDEHSLRIQAPSEAVANFLLRIRYTKKESWEAELREQYTYHSAEEHIASLEASGLRVDYAGEVHNPYLVRNWWENEGIRIFSTSGRELELPPTNFVAYATKPTPWQLRSLKIEKQAVTKPSWLKLIALRDRTNDLTWDLIDVGGVTQAYIPFERTSESLFLYLLPQKETPGTLLYQKESPLSRAHYGGTQAGMLTQVTEAHTDAVQGLKNVARDKSFSLLDATSERLMETKALEPFFPSPGGSNEIVHPFVFDLKGRGESDVFKSGTAKRFEVNQLLAGAHVGSIPDPVLEAVAYALALEHHYPILSWTGVAPLLHEQSAEGLRLLAKYPISKQVPQEGLFEPVPSIGFMDVVSVKVTRETSEGKITSTHEEYSIPRHRLPDTITAIPYILVRGKILVGLENRALPALASRDRDPNVEVVPAWRLSKKVHNWVEAGAELKARMKADFGLVPLSATPLGSGYFPSVGNAPEFATPFAVEVDMRQVPRDLVFISLANLLKDVDKLPDLHSRISIYRFAHAVGVLESVNAE